MLGEREKRYVVGCVIGEGSFGITYVAFDTKLEMKVAIKEFYPRKYAVRSGTKVEFKSSQNASMEALREETIKEARSLAKLDALEGVVEVKEYFRDNNTLYIVMEYIEGVTLLDYLRQNDGKIQTLTPEEAKQMMRPIIESLIQIHDQGMIHRDISPDNIMVLSNGRLKLIDFGTAKGMEEEDQLALGKNGYAPPEQFDKNGKQGAWTDVYALAATYYYCIMGIRPPISTQRLINDTLIKPSQKGVSIRSSEEDALLVALCPNSNQRFQNMRAIYNAFYNQMDVVPTAKPAKNIKWIVVVAIAAVACLTVGLGVFGGSKDAPPDDLRNTPTQQAEPVPELPTTQPSTTEGKEPGLESLFKEWETAIRKRDYDNVIDEIVKCAKNFEEDEMQTAQELLEKAVEGWQNQYKTEVNRLVTSKEYNKALDMSDQASGEMIIMKNLISEAGFDTGYMEEEIFDNQYHSIIEEYKGYLQQNGDLYAQNCNDEYINEMFAMADQYISGEEYNQIKENVYTTLVWIQASKYMEENTEPQIAIEYINKYVEKTNYNCLIIEYLDVYREQYRKQNNLPSMSAEVLHVSNGYILENSNTAMLMDADLAHLTQYELYLAAFEIYARHGRLFSDDAVTNYFSRYGWYYGTIKPQEFDESDLNEFEKKNVRLIVQYQQSRGYR